MKRRLSLTALVAIVFVGLTSADVLFVGAQQRSGARPYEGTTIRAIVNA